MTDFRGGKSVSADYHQKSSGKKNSPLDWVARYLPLTAGRSGSTPGIHRRQAGAGQQEPLRIPNGLP